MADFDFTDEVRGKLEADGAPNAFVESFLGYYQELVAGHTGLIHEDEILPVHDLPKSTELDQNLKELGEEAARRTVLIKLNGGLGTSMGLQKAKSLLPLRNNLTFLDIIANQALKTELPLVLMNSLHTQDDSIEALKKFNFDQSSLLTFIQHRAPKIRQDDLRPVIYATDPELEWNPPGHGDIYLSLETSGLLDQLISQNIQYAFISNSDNLGANFDPVILGYMAKHSYPFLMEVTRRTEADKKGGHLAIKDNQLVLRELAQTNPEDQDAFADINRHLFFNTNNLWIDLIELKDTLMTNNCKLNLPLIRNAKTVNPTNPHSTPVFQIETAMGSAIQIFNNSQAIEVPRTRFAPVKTTNDLLLVRSDLYELNDQFQLQPKSLDQEKPTIDLDSRFYKFINDFEQRFPAGSPILADCQELKVEGDFTFGADVKIQGKVHLKPQPQTISDNQVIS
ncbi:UTP--glucose-1-phosphate uridylyltransferase [Candidatus Berkelbacteria bacterium]|nr:UTP--glucose-1-phosphate uridylyltransferase [Candidatus Berkelbacteria bacterium]